MEIVSAFGSRAATVAASEIVNSGFRFMTVVLDLGSSGEALRKRQGERELCTSAH